MDELLTRVVPLGIGAAFTPSLLALQILIVSGDPWRRRALAVALGSGLAFGIVGLLVFLGFAQLPVRSAAPSSPDVVGGVLRLGAAAALTGASVYLLWPHPALQRRVEAGITARAAKASVLVFFAMAFLLSIKDISSFVMLVPALHDIAVAPVSALARAVALVVLYALALLGVLAPPAVRLVLGHRANGALHAIYRFTMDNQFRIVGVVAVLMTVYLLATGIADLR